MLKPIIWKNVSHNERLHFLQRPVRKNNEEFNTKIKEMIKQIRHGGDAACRQMTERYDGVKINELRVSLEEFAAAREKVAPAVYEAIRRVITQLSLFHSLQRSKDYSIEVSAGVLCENRTIPIERVGLYIPGGTAPLVSTTLMLGVPSRIAGCPVRILCSPPKHNGNIDPHILVAAELCGIDQIYKLGGVQAITAMAYGTESVAKVDKIFGPGNTYVTQAKMLVAQDIIGATYDLLAGPSEVLVIADKDANAEYIAADLLAQAEHGSDSQVLLICSDVNICDKVNDAIGRQIQSLTRRSIIHEALENSRMIVTDSIAEALEISNSYAPEHLILQVKEPRKYLDKITAAGSIFLGQWSPVTAGDYVSGTNHVLPTDGYAKKFSGLSVRDFMKTMSIQELTKNGLIDLEETINILTAIEGLDAHMKAVKIRLENKDGK